MRVKCWSELLQYGAQAVLERVYGSYIVQPESGYDFSVQIDLEQLPQSQEEKDDLIRRISLLKRNAMAAPYEQAFAEYDTLREEAAKYTSESAPQGVKEGGEVRAIHYREEEAIYIKASHDRVTVIFSTVFREETDRVFGKVFLQEFVDARRRAIQNAPQVMFRSEPPLELQGVRGLPSGKGEIGYITFGKGGMICWRHGSDKLQFSSHDTFRPSEGKMSSLTFKHSETTSTIISKPAKHISTRECEDGQQTSCKVGQKLVIVKPHMLTSLQCYAEPDQRQRRRNERLLVEGLSECRHKVHVILTLSSMGHSHVACDRMIWAHSYCCSTIKKSKIFSSCLVGMNLE